MEDCDMKPSQYRIMKSIRFPYGESGQIMIYCLNKKNIELDSDLIPLIEDTDFPKEISHIPWDYFFIDNNFVLNEEIIIKGLAVAKSPFNDCYLYIGTIYFKQYNQSVNLTFRNDYNDEKVTNNEILNKASDTSEVLLIRKYLIEHNNYLRDYLFKIINNFVTFINNSHSDIEYIDKIFYNSKSRINRGKLPNTNCTYIKLQGKIKQYAINYKSNRAIMNMMYLVRGHWRNYIAERYVNVKGKKEWIYPYYKGTGQDVSKNNVIIKKGEVA
jgi:hypothetical protein